MNSLDASQRPILAAHARLKIDPVSRDPVILFPEGLLVLNATAQEIVRRCNGETSIAEIILQLADEFEVSEDILRDDVLENLELLRQRNLILLTK